MHLETEIGEQLKLFHRKIGVSKKQGPELFNEHVHGPIDLSPNSRSSKDEWKFNESIVYNYLVYFKEVANCIYDVNTLNKESILEMVPVMGGVMEGISASFQPEPVFFEPLTAYTFGNTDQFGIQCGRFVFTKEIGKRKSTTRYELDDGYHHNFFAQNGEYTSAKSLLEVVKVTFCPTLKIAQFIAENEEKYPVLGIDPLFLKPKELKEIYKGEKKSFFEKVFGSG